MNHFIGPRALLCAVLSVSLGGILAATGVVGCGQDRRPPESSSSSSEPPAALPALPPEGAKTTLREPPAQSQPELRAMFVTTAYNNDWPSKPSLHKRIQQDEIEAIITRAKRLNVNVIVLQVRGFGDRIYRRSELSGPYKEIPWAQALNYGHDPDPLPQKEYDPLGSWMNACKREGIELHAWINPFRLHDLVSIRDTTPTEDDDPYLPVIKWEKQLYLDPSSPAVQKYVKAVLIDFLDQYGHRVKKQGGEQPRQETGKRKGIFEDDGGIDAILVDHVIPPTPPPNPDPDKKRDPCESLPVDEEGMTGAEKRVNYLVRKYCTLPHIPPETTQVTVEQFLQEVFDIVDGRMMKFGLSPKADDKIAMKLLTARKVHYVLPEVYYPERFQQDLKNWLAAIPTVPNGELPPVVAPALNTVRVQLPATPQSNTVWPDSEITEQMQLLRDLTVNQRKAVGEAHFSAMALRLPDQAGPQGGELRKNLAVRLKERHYKEPRPVPPMRPGTANDGPRMPKVFPPDANSMVRWEKGPGRPPQQWEVYVHEPPATPGAEEWTVHSFGNSVDRVEVNARVDRVWVRGYDKFNRPSPLGKWPAP